MTHHIFETVDVAAEKMLVHRLASGTGRRILFTRTEHQAHKWARHSQVGEAIDRRRHFRRGSARQPDTERPRPQPGGIHGRHREGSGRHRHCRPRCARRRCRTRGPRRSAIGTQSVSVPFGPNRAPAAPVAGPDSRVPVAVDAVTRRPPVGRGRATRTSYSTYRSRFGYGLGGYGLR